MKPGDKDATPKVSYIVGVPEWSWSIGAGMWIDDVATTFWGMTLSLATILIPAIALLLVLIFFSSRNVSRLLATSVDNMTRIAAGDLSVEVSAQQRGDEIGAIARAVQVFKDNAIALDAGQSLPRRRRSRSRPRPSNATKTRASAMPRRWRPSCRSFSDALRRFSNGEFNFRLNEAFSPEYEVAAAGLERVPRKAADAVAGRLARSPDSIQASAQEISTASDDLSRRTEQQAASLEETAAALDEITATVKKAAEGANHAREVVAAAQG